MPKRSRSTCCLTFGKRWIIVLRATTAHAKLQLMRYRAAYKAQDAFVVQDVPATINCARIAFYNRFLAMYASYTNRRINLRFVVFAKLWVAEVFHTKYSRISAKRTDKGSGCANAKSIENGCVFNVGVRIDVPGMILHKRLSLSTL